MKNFLNNYLFNVDYYINKKSIFNGVNIMTSIWICFVLFLSHVLIVLVQPVMSVSDWVGIPLALFIMLIDTQPAVTNYRKDNENIDKLFTNCFWVLVIAFLISFMFFN